LVLIGSPRFKGSLAEEYATSRRATSTGALLLDQLPSNLFSCCRPTRPSWPSMTTRPPSRATITAPSYPRTMSSRLSATSAVPTTTAVTPTPSAATLPPSMPHLAASCPACRGRRATIRFASTRTAEPLPRPPCPFTSDTPRMATPQWMAGSAPAASTGPPLACRWRPPREAAIPLLMPPCLVLPTLRLTILTPTSCRPSLPTRPCLGWGGGRRLSCWALRLPPAISRRER